MPGKPGRPWGSQGSASDEVIGAPLDTTAIDQLDAAAILAGYWWDDDAAFAAEEDVRSILAPFGPRFPGLASPITGQLDPELMRSTSPSVRKPTVVSAALMRSLRPS